MAGKAWSQSDIDYLVENYENMTCEEIAKNINRTTRSVQHKFGQLDLERKQPSVGDKYNRLTIRKIYQVFKYGQNISYAEVECDCEAKTIFDVKLTSVVQGSTKSCSCLKSEIQRERAIERNYKHGQSNNGNVLFKRWCNLKFKYEFCDDWLDFTKYEKWCLENGWTENHFIKRYNETGCFEPLNCCCIEKQYTNTRLYHIWDGVFRRCYNTKFKQYCSYGARGIRVDQEWFNFLNFKDWSLSNGYNDDLSLDKIDNNYHYGPNNCRWATLQQQVESKHNNRQILAFNEVKSIIHWTQDIRCKVDVETLKNRLLNGWSPEDAITKEKDPS